MAPATDFDHATHQAGFEEAAAVLDARSDTLSDLIRSGVWGEAAGGGAV